MNPEPEWMLTAYGTEFYPSRPTIEEINIDDIAHSLSNVCRWGGHCRKHYSVAQHSCLVYDLVCKMTERPEVRLYALLHDASEAYLSDITRPVKSLLLDYRWLEQAVMEVIKRKFHLFQIGPEGYDIVKHADNILLVTERRDLLPRTTRQWEILQYYDPLPEVIRPWKFAKSRRRFLNRFYGEHLMIDPRAYAIEETTPQTV